MHFLRFILGPRIRPNLVKIWQFLAKRNTILPKDPAATLLFIHPTDLKLMSENIYTPMFIVGLGIIVKNWKQKDVLQ